MHIIKPLPGTLPMPGHSLAAIGLWPMNSLGNKVFDLSGNGRDAALQGTASWISGQFGSCINLDDDGEYVLSTFNPHTVLAEGAFTVAIWVKGHANWAGIIAAAAIDGFPNCFHIRQETLVGNNTKLRVGLGDTLITTTSAIFDTTIWQQLVVTFDGTYASVYINGILKEVLDFSGWTGGYNDNNLAFGTRGTLELRGLIDIPSIYNRVLSASEIALLYRESFCMFPEPIMPEFGIAA